MVKTPLRDQDKSASRHPQDPNKTIQLKLPMDPEKSKQPQDQLRVSQNKNQNERDDRDQTPVLHFSFHARDPFVHSYKDEGLVK